MTETDSTLKAAGIVLAAAILLTGLMAGLYFAFSCAVMPGLARADDRTFITTMQRINAAIQNPTFFLSFFGAFLFPLIAAFLQWRAGERGAAVWTVAALVLYTVTLITTMAVNVPLNDALDRAGDPSKITDLAGVRRAFEGSWVAWNSFRTVFSIAALLCLLRAVFVLAK